RLARQTKAVQKSPSLRGRAVEEWINGRRQPHHANVVGESRCRADAFAVDTAFAYVYRFLAGQRIDAGAERRKPQHAFSFGRYGPRAIPFGKSEFFHGGTPQSAARRKQRDCLA